MSEEIKKGINRIIAHRTVAKILEDVVTNDRLDAEIPVEYEQTQADKIAKEVEAIMNEHVAASKDVKT